MNWDRIEGNWKQFRARSAHSGASSTDDDLDVIDGRREELAGRIQKAYGVTKDEAEQQIDQFAGTLDSGTSDMRTDRGTLRSNN